MPNEFITYLRGLGFEHRVVSHMGSTPDEFRLELRNTWTSRTITVRVYDHRPLGGYFVEYVDRPKIYKGRFDRPSKPVGDQARKIQESLRTLER